MQIPKHIKTCQPVITNSITEITISASIAATSKHNRQWTEKPQNTGMKLSYNTISSIVQNWMKHSGHTE